MTTAVASPFESRTQQILESLRQSGQLKHLQTIEGTMGATVRLRGYGTVACFCSNNYLGLADHPEVVEAGIEGLRRYGAGSTMARDTPAMASMICEAKNGPDHITTSPPMIENTVTTRPAWLRGSGSP